MCDLFDHTNGGNFCTLFAPPKKERNTSSETRNQKHSHLLMNIPYIFKQEN